MKTDLRDRCCYKRCRHDSTLIFMGVGLCDHHWSQTCAVHMRSYDYLITRLIPEAVSELRYRGEQLTRTDITTKE